MLTHRRSTSPSRSLTRTIRITVRLFAGIRERAGTAHVQVELPSGGTVDQALAAASKAVPGEWRLPSRFMIAVNGEYAGQTTKLGDGDEIALVPPVSGGAGRAPAASKQRTPGGRARPGKRASVAGQDKQQRQRAARSITSSRSQGEGQGGGQSAGTFPAVTITHQPLHAAPLVEYVRTDRDGAVVTFFGVTRNHNEGRRVLHLEYEAYQPMAERKIAEIIAEMKAKWDIGRVAVAHRTGRVDIGETSMVLAVSAPHRRPAFEAALYFVDRLKEVVPIWKKEYFEGGEMWVGETPGAGSPAAGRGRKS